MENADAKTVSNAFKLTLSYKCLISLFILIPHSFTQKQSFPPCKVSLKWETDAEVYHYGQLGVA